MEFNTMITDLGSLKLNHWDTMVPA